MFRLVKLKPPHGWSAVGWELGIIILGVLVALAAQQWAEGLSWSGKIGATKRALRAEMQEHYGYAVEYRAVYPCLQAQLDQLRTRVLSSHSALNPAPLYTEGLFHYVVRFPSKTYATDISRFQSRAPSPHFTRCSPGPASRAAAGSASPEVRQGKR